MSEQETWRGKFKEIFIADEKGIENKCKEICELHGIKNLDGYLDSWVEQLKEDLSDRYLVLGNIIYEYLEKEDLRYDSFCNLTKTGPFTYKFITSFHNGGTCLSEMIEEALKKIEEE